MQNRINCYKVLWCKRTACFPQAIFINKLKALEWANENCPNPKEGFIIEFVWMEVFDNG